MDIYINKLTLIGTEENIDTFLQEQVVDGRMSFGSILPMPEDLIQAESSYETEFIYSDYDNALIFTRTDSGFSYKHVNANIYAYYNDNPKHDWLASNCCYRKRSAAAGIAIKFREYYSVDTDVASKSLGSIYCILASHGIDYQQGFIWFCFSFYFCKLVH